MREPLLRNVLPRVNRFYFPPGPVYPTSKMQWSFKKEMDFDARKAESSIIRSKYPQRIPVIVQKAPRSNVPTIDRHKFLVPNDISVAQLMWIIRKRINLSPEKAIFLFVGKVMPQSSANMSVIYEDYVDDDGFLYIMYSGESTFGDKMC